MQELESAAPFKFFRQGVARQLTRQIFHGNPPFHNGEKHVLKAWDLLWDGEVVMIINAETIRNPLSMERQRLVKLIEEFGDVEFVEGAL